MVDAGNRECRRPVGLNNRGQITGIFSDSEGTHAFLMEGGVFTTIAVPGAVGRTLALDINDVGPVAGAFDVEGHGVLQDRRRSRRNEHRRRQRKRRSPEHELP